MHSGDNAQQLDQGTSEIEMDETWDDARAACQAALSELVEGRSEPFKALWSHSPDAVIMGAFGGYERGWDEVGPRLDWASRGINATNRNVENVVTIIGSDLACTVDLEHMDRTIDGTVTSRTLRCTQVYRREDGRWKVVIRHADELPSKDLNQSR